MALLLSGTFGNFCVRKLVVYRCTSVRAPQRCERYISSAVECRILVRASKPRSTQFQQNRKLGGKAGTGLRILRFLRPRNVIVGSLVGGGMMLHEKYMEIREMFPGIDRFANYARPLFRTLQNAQTYVENSELQNWLSRAGGVVRFSAEWVDKIADGDFFNLFSSDDVTTLEGASLNAALSVRDGVHAATAANSGYAGSGAQTARLEARLSELQNELVTSQSNAQKELERLERENRELRKELILKRSTAKARQMRRSLIDMYSEVLDELSDYYETGYDFVDHLPRVVVVGDQSSGKTSVLEMIAQARIFPRGGGEMMTRTPVQVTLSEGPFHIAKFKDSSREYDLTKESELKDLRREIELRMERACSDGKTVSAETISLYVQGPGLQRMVLVDLPGIISTVTSGMAENTREFIKDLVKTHMKNPNAIILCVQDGSIDAERSIVTELVSQMDPAGRRTIFVLTKVDMAEASLYNPERIRKMLDGRLFPMRALGYFAVVTGRGSARGRDEAITDIKAYEQEFFSHSRLFREGALKPSQMTTGNLSKAVSEQFWRIVKESVDQQADHFRARRYNLETEWKNLFARHRELDRAELFEKARGEILDEMVTLSQVSSKSWEDEFASRLWASVARYVFEDIYMHVAQADSSSAFHTQLDIRLREWTDSALPKLSVEVGRRTLHDQFSRLLLGDAAKSDKTETERELERVSVMPNSASNGVVNNTPLPSATHSDSDAIYQPFKQAVRDECWNQHQWDEKAETSLRILQLQALEDRHLSDKSQWDAAIRFFEQAVRSELFRTDGRLRNLLGPTTTEAWLRWRGKTEDERKRAALLEELDRLLPKQSSKKRGSSLAQDEITTIKRNLETQNLEINNDMIDEMWRPAYRKHALQRALQTCQDCKKGFAHHQRGFTDVPGGLNCNEVVLFWRIQRMIQVTANSLRQQVMNNETRRLERITKSVIDDLGENPNALRSLFVGKRVDLAEEIRRVRHIQEKLEEFIKALGTDKDHS